MNAKIGYVFFLTSGLLLVLALLLFHPVALSADAKPILESVLGALTTILMSTIHSVFQSPAAPANPTAPAIPATKGASP